ncbi:MAG: hypothetical protein M1360_01520 [Candidatus Marsarchaeota archaeon]|jgi:DNA-binding Lrp family transcriptional regulator|nr:hypothetical protein [Candidatus Marsarchaeota archaeon]MCL5418601.1 hypothetical protein [Candidatus Marsarchaeota archaeon]
MRLNDNSRLSLRTLGRELGISYHVVAAKLKELEERYKLFYTLDIDTSKLGFAEGRLITIKFERMPSIDIIKGKFAKDIFVQDAYLAQGDFDLLLYVVGLTPRDFQNWQFSLRTAFSEYKPLLKVSNLNSLSMGFFPLKNGLIKETTMLSNAEKRILMLLNENSRIKLNELIKAAHTTQMSAIYIIKKLKKLGIIKKFSALVQNPEKRVFEAFGAYLYPSSNHSQLALDFKKELVNEDLHEYSNDYNVIVDTNGSFDIICICSFNNGEKLAKRGPDIIKELWKEENPEIEKAILTDVIVGKWPFALNRYRFAEKDIK